MSAAQFQRYPMVMRHPAETPAIVSQWDERLQRHVPEHGQAAKWQPVTVHTADDEAYYEAQGYRADGGDPQSYEAAVANLHPAGYEFQEYPKWIDNGTPEGVTVNSAAQEQDVRARLANVGDGAVAAASLPLTVAQTTQAQAETTAQAPQISEDELAAFRAWKAQQGATKVEAKSTQPESRRKGYAERVKGQPAQVHTAPAATAGDAD